jgi:hypothetical protein
LILQATLIWRLTRDDAPGGHTQSSENAPHQIRLVAGKIIVHRDNVDAPGRDRVQISSEGGNQSLTLTGFHFRDVPEVQSTTTHELNVKVAKAKGALRGLAHSGKRLWQQLVERLARCVAGAQLLGFASKFVIAEVGKFVFQVVDGISKCRQPTKKAAFTDPKDPL